MIHSYWAYLVLTMIIVASFNALAKYVGGKEFQAIDFRISLFTLIVFHIQLLLGLVLYFVSPNGLKNITANGMSGLDSFARLLAVEHPFVGILAVVFVTIGYSKHKKKLTSKPKFKVLSIFYTLGLLLALSRIPWSNWL
jgi:NADH:ubiquinone oxidoreductase subunit 2 (subunit N)